MDYDQLSSDRLGEWSAVIRERVEAAGEIQRGRFAVSATSGDVAVHGQGVACNADMRVGDVRRFCKLDEALHASQQAETNDGVIFV